MTQSPVQIQLEKGFLSGESNLEPRHRLSPLEFSYETRQHRSTEQIPRDFSARLEDVARGKRVPPADLEVQEIVGRSHFQSPCVSNGWNDPELQSAFFCRLCKFVGWRSASLPSRRPISLLRVTNQNSRKNFRKYDDTCAFGAHSRNRDVKCDVMRTHDVNRSGDVKQARSLKRKFNFQITQKTQRYAIHCLNLCRKIWALRQYPTLKARLGFDRVRKRRDWASTKSEKSKTELRLSPKKSVAELRPSPERKTRWTWNERRPKQRNFRFPWCHAQL